MLHSLISLLPLSLEPTPFKLLSLPFYKHSHEWPPYYETQWLILSPLLSYEQHLTQISIFSFKHFPSCHPRFCTLLICLWLFLLSFLSCLLLILKDGISQDPALGLIFFSIKLHYLLLVPYVGWWLPNTSLPPVPFPPTSNCITIIFSWIPIKLNYI